MNKKFLVLGQMPQHFSPDECLCAGPWCFAGQEKLFPDWEKIYHFAPEPLANKKKLFSAALAAKTLCMQSIPGIAKLLSSDYQNFPAVYWQTLLMPWLIRVSSQIIEKCLRVRSMVDLWKDEELIVLLMDKEYEFNFIDEHDYDLNGCLGKTYNLWLFSRILEYSWPKRWKKEYLKISGETPSVISTKSLLKSIYTSINLNLPFPRLKGMSVKQSMKFSLAIYHPCKSVDTSQNLLNIYSDFKILDEYPSQSKLLQIFYQSLPLSIKRLKHNQKKCAAKYKKPRLRIASTIAYEDSSYRQNLAYWRARGNRLAYVQHGGNYGQVAVACDTSMVEYSQADFFTWGWQKHDKGNFIPLPSPQLSAAADSWRKNIDGPMIFVGTEMAAYGYRLDSRPTPLEFIEYRKAKSVFFENLPIEIQRKTLYRPYFNLPGTLEDAGWLLPRFPEIKQCSGELLPQIINCRLLVLDHHGTTMLEAFAANIPVILYWDKNAWPLTDECEKLLALLERAGIWYPTPELAAKKVIQIWDDPEGWQSQASIQQARAVYCHNQARYATTGLDKIWIKTLEKL